MSRVEGHPQQAELLAALRTFAAKRAKLHAEAKERGVQFPTLGELSQIKRRTGLVGARGFWAAVAVRSHVRSDARPGPIRSIRVRAPHGRRVRSSRTSRGAPARSTDDGPLPQADLARGLCARGHRGEIVWPPGKLVPTCAACLRELDEALAERGAA